MFTTLQFWIGVLCGAAGFAVAGVAALFALCAWWDMRARDSRDEDTE